MDNIDRIKLSSQLKQLNATLQQVTMVQHSRHGLVTIQMNGRQDVLTIRIKSQLPGMVSSRELAQEVKTVFNEVLKSSKEQARQETIRIIGVDIAAWGDFF